jgi:hypothetical protein
MPRYSGQVHEMPCEACPLPRQNRATSMFKRWQLSLITVLFLLGTAAVPTAFAQSSVPVTATCKDGTTFSGKSKRGACSHHGGVQTFDSASGSQAGASPPTTATSSAPPPPTAPVKSYSTTANSSAVKVWVNTASNVYHCPGTRYYGKTKAGEYMSEAAAKAKGDRPSRGKACS